MIDSPEVQLACLSCGLSGTPVLYRLDDAHIGARCASCKAFLKWVPHTSPWLALLDAQHEASQSNSWRKALIGMGVECWNIAEAHGFHDKGGRSTLERAMLVVTELAELSEAARHDTLQSPSDHIPVHTQAAEEWADVLVRVFDHCVDDGVTHADLADAFLAKMEFNRTRPYRHGGKTI